MILCSTYCEWRNEYKMTYIKKLLTERTKTVSGSSNTEANTSIWLNCTVVWQFKRSYSFSLSVWWAFHAHRRQDFDRAFICTYYGFLSQRFVNFGISWFLYFVGVTDGKDEKRWLGLLHFFLFIIMTWNWRICMYAEETTESLKLHFDVDEKFFFQMQEKNIL